MILAWIILFLAAIALAYFGGEALGDSINDYAPDKVLSFVDLIWCCVLWAGSANVAIYLFELIDLQLGVI